MTNVNSFKNENSWINQINMNAGYVLFTHLPVLLRYCVWHMLLKGDARLNNRDSTTGNTWRCLVMLDGVQAARPADSVEKSERTPLQDQPELSAVAGVPCWLPTSSTETPGRHESQFERATWIALKHPNSKTPLRTLPRKMWVARERPGV